MNAKTHEWLESVQVSSIPLRHINDQNMPDGCGSGCLIRFHGRRILLSVAHVTKRTGRWAIELRHDSKTKLTSLFYPAQFNYIAEANATLTKIREVDFSYVEIPDDIDSYFQDLKPHGHCSFEKRRTVFSPAFDVLPSSSECYGFSGQVLASFDANLNALITEHCTYPGLTYSRTQDGRHFFKLPVKHPGHEQFEGCSGAPILDRKGNVVALVSGGDPATDEIYGINLAKYQVALHASYGGI